MLSFCLSSCDSHEPPALAVVLSQPQRYSTVVEVSLPVFVHAAFDSDFVRLVLSCAFLFLFS